MTEIERLKETLRKVEALFTGTTFDGERGAAALAMERLRQRLKELEATDPPVEFRFSLADLWSRKLFMALLRRYGLTPYRHRGQRYTTVMVRLSRSFLDQTLWPEFLELSKLLSGYLDEVTNRVISEAVHADSSDAEVREELPAPK